MSPYYYYESDMGFLILSALTSSIPSLLLSVAAYVLTAWALYSMAKRREIKNPWLAWIPVVNCWILGSLSDQYQYLVKGQNKSKRKILLVLNLVMLALTLTIIVLVVVMVFGAIAGHGDPEAMMGPAMGLLGMFVPLMGVAIALMIVQYMALYDVYRSMDPSNSVLFLVLSILISITEPAFLFFNRNKDLGMPPRKKQEPAYMPIVDADEDPWAPNQRNYQ